jgi:hypothetical protein
MARPAFGSRWANGPPMAHGIAEGSIKIKAQVGDHVPGLGLVMVERVTGIELALSAWEVTSICGLGWPGVDALRRNRGRIANDGCAPPYDHRTSQGRNVRYMVKVEHSTA